jgi:hypothetical protein
MTTRIMRLALLTTVITSTAVAFTSLPQTLVDDIKRDSIVKATREILLRDSPPKQRLIYIRGEKIGTIAKGETLEVTGESEFRNLFGKQKWIQVKRDESSLKPEDPVRGWLYVGNLGDKSCCVELR